MFSRRRTALFVAALFGLFAVAFTIRTSQKAPRVTPEPEWPDAHMQLNGSRSKLPDYYIRLLTRSLLQGPASLANDVTVDDSAPEILIAGARYRWLSPGIILIRDNQQLLYHDPLPQILDLPSTDSADAVVARLESLIPTDPTTGQLKVIKLPGIELAIVEPPPDDVELSLHDVNQIVRSILNGPTGVSPDVYVPQVPVAEISIGNIQTYHCWAPGIVLMNDVGVLNFFDPLPDILD